MLFQDWHVAVNRNWEYIVNPSHYLPLPTTDTSDRAGYLLFHHPSYTKSLRSPTPNLKHIDLSHHQTAESYIYNHDYEIHQSAAWILLSTTRSLPPCFSRSTLHPTSPHPTTRNTRVPSTKARTKSVASTQSRQRNSIKIPPARHFANATSLVIAHTSRTRGKEHWWLLAAIHARRRSSTLTRTGACQTIKKRSNLPTTNN